MKNKWLGYLSGTILILAGILEFTIANYLVGTLFVVAGIGSLIVQIIFARKTK
ncbi:MAG: hypothetical protein SFY56_05960 [Bacteroidota bacterium]|nr:hypothetical protein [Bacteroidota bacterium]